MAVTVALVKRTRIGNVRRVIADITGPASYTANGEVLTIAQVQALMPEVFSNTASLPATAAAVIQTEVEVPPTGHALCLDRSSWKFRYFNGTTEIAGAVNLSAVTIRVVLSYGVGTG